MADNVVRTDDRYEVCCTLCSPPRVFAVAVQQSAVDYAVALNDPSLHDGHDQDAVPHAHHRGLTLQRLARVQEECLDLILAGRRYVPPIVENGALFPAKWVKDGVSWIAATPEQQAVMTR